jgi:5-methylcytosine-specific restriction endonuclease McrA
LICKRCGTEDKRVLEAHHIDSNRKNNTIQNLVWLCRNCHHLVHNHKEKL